MATRNPDSLDRLSHADLIGVVRELIGEVGRLRAENEKLGVALTQLKAEHQAVKDELARLKHLPPRPPQKPSGMDNATDRGGSGNDDKSPKSEKSSHRRGSQLNKLTIGATILVRVKAPAGSRHKGYEDIVVQDLSLSPQVTLYRRERWETPEGERIIAELDPGIVGGYGPNLHRFVLALHFSGQVTCDRIVALLNGMGVMISKRQVVRLLTAKLETFRAEDAAVLKAGLGGAYVTADDTGARHAGKSGYTTQIGSDTFTVFRTGPSKSRLAFLSRLCGSTAFYVINDAALDYMKERQLPPATIDKFADHEERIFSCPEAWERHLQALGLTELKVTPDPVLIATEGALWGAIRHQGLLPDTVIVSDDAGQFRVGIRALCWVHYLESDFILGIAPSTPMDAGFEPTWTPDKFRPFAEGRRVGGRRCRSRFGQRPALRSRPLAKSGVSPAHRTAPCSGCGCGFRPPWQLLKRHAPQTPWKPKPDLFAFLQSLKFPVFILGRSG